MRVIRIIGPIDFGGKVGLVRSVVVGMRKPLLRFGTLHTSWCLNILWYSGIHLGFFDAGPLNQAGRRLKRSAELR